MIMKMISKMATLVFKLWLTIIETSPVKLSMSFCFIKSKLIQSSNHYNNNYQKQLLQNQSSGSLTQTELIRKKNRINVAIINDRAYWVHNNVFYTSEIIDGVIDGENAVGVDAYSLSPSEVSLLMNVLDAISS